MIQYMYDPTVGGEGEMELLAFVVGSERAPNEPPGANFLTDPKEPQQVAVVRYGSGHVIPPHVHLEHARSITRTVEVLVVRAGEAILDVYDGRGNRAGTALLRQGDVAVLLRGGHGLVAGRDGVELLEVKNGPYAGSRAADKREL